LNVVQKCVVFIKWQAVIVTKVEDKVSLQKTYFRIRRHHQGYTFSSLGTRPSTGALHRTPSLRKDQAGGVTNKILVIEL
jgi:hypothetical protein